MNFVPDNLINKMDKEFERFAIFLEDNGIYIRERNWFCNNYGIVNSVVSPLPSIH